jgi:type II secretory pathway component PulK
MKRRASRRGGALVVAMVTLLVVTLIAGAVVRSFLAEHRQARQSQNELQAQWLAESAIARAAARLAQLSDYAGETWQPKLGASDGEADSGTVEIQVEKLESSAPARRIVAIAHYPNHEWRRVTVRREHILSLSPTIE